MRIRWYVLAVIVAAVIAGTGLALVGPPYTAGAATAVSCFAIFAIVAQLLSHRVASGAVGSIAFIPYLAAALLVPNVFAVVGIAVSRLTAALLSKQEPLKLVFNTAQATLAISIGILGYLAAGGEPLLAAQDPLGQAIRVTAIPLLVLIALFLAVNTLAVSGAIAVSQARPLMSVLRQNVRASILNDVMSSPVVYIFAWTYSKLGVWGAVFFALPLLGVRELYRTNHQLQQVNQDLLELMVKAIEARDPYTSGHSRRVAHYSRIIARAIGLTGKEVDRIGTAALLHDVGKIHEIYAPILRKPDKLTPDEWAVMQTHPIKSAELVATVSQLRPLASIVRNHHENWDGSGYPDGLAGEEIPLGSRIILFADTIDAMTTDRPYRKALREPQVRAELMKYRGKQFDPYICDRLLSSPMFGLLFSASRASPEPDKDQPAHRTAVMA